MLELIRGQTEQAETGTARLPRTVDDLAVLAAACSRGDANATATLLTAVGPSVLQMVRRVLGGRDPDVEDVFQESLLAVARAMPTFRNECSTRHFACRIATLTALKARRRRNGEREGARSVGIEEAENVDGGANLHLASSRRQIVRRLLDELPAPQAEALVLHCVAGMTVEEIAFTMTSAIETVRSRLRLAKNALRKRIASDPSMLDVAEEAP